LRFGSKLDLVPVLSVSDLPEDVVADAKRAAVLVAMIAVRERVGDELREVVAYLLASAPARRGEHPAPGPEGSGTGDDVEAGLIGGDLVGLAERIAARVGGARSPGSTQPRAELPGDPHLVPAPPPRPALMLAPRRLP
jgi:hypothetical protein